MMEIAFDHALDNSGNNVAARDENGLLRDPAARALVGSLAGDTDPAAMEVALALDAAGRAVGRVPWTGARGGTLPNGSVEILLSLNAAQCGLTMGRLARSTGLPPDRTGRLVEVLGRKGLVTRRRDPHDRRSFRATLTPEGAEVLASLREPAQSAVAALFAGFSEAELAQLRDWCLRVGQNSREVRGRSVRRFGSRR